MSESQKSMTQKLQESAPNARQTVRFMTAATVGTILFILSGLTLTATVLALIVATPLLVLFSPVLVPAGMALVLMIGGFVTSGGFGVAALSALTWLYNYVAGKQPVGADQLDHAKNTLAGKAKEYGQYVQHKAHEVTHPAWAVPAKGIAVDKLIEMATPSGMITIPVVKWIYKYLKENYPDEVDSVKEALGSKIEDSVVNICRKKPTRRCSESGFLNLQRLHPD